MLTAFLAPEFVVGWAAWQFLNARRVAKAFNDELRVQPAQPYCYRRAIWQKLVVMLLGGSRSLSDGWTETHGFFAWMGGFMLYVDGGPRGILTPDELLQFVRDGCVEMPAITEADIKDRSKGDMLSKWVAILQLVWFVIQLIARYIQNLPVTLLEIDTLGVAALTCISYGFWLNKPKDVRLPYIVHWKDPTAPPLPDSLDSDKEHGTLSILRLLFNYGTELTGGLTPDKITIIIGCISGMAFGVIHCLGWNFLFPRHAEQILWRVASIGIPFTFSGIQLPMLLNVLDGWISFRPPFSRVNTPISGYIAVYYIPARVSIIVLMMLSLRSLPPGTYDTVAWSKFIPHVTM
ncbi:uncharacterized protein BJ212DRAFT_1432092 [Suillus subaureus]|uniref:Uncharacterized protein n=1 Tax=Suillus subaureus TaxID=48587 RepID=A0A9P7E8V1_9AGAM|nr:uncharacterized protein BJ212DRAFT_1432092 [Suillus subaureus]KAG1814712.1 hypothetical protein BJ212DRAFT_1432092 [Suillus subaureus]